MTLKIIKQPYELMFRFAPDGQVDGHFKQLETILDGDLVLSVREGETLEVEAGGAVVEAILGQVTVALTAQVCTLEVERQALLSRIDELEAYVPAPVTGDSVPMRSARLALIAAGLFHAVDGAIQAMTGPEGDIARTEWEYSRTLRRDHPLLAQLGPVIGITEEQIDELFIIAAGIQ